MEVVGDRKQIRGMIRTKKRANKIQAKKSEAVSQMYIIQVLSSQLSETTSTQREVSLSLEY